MTTAGSSSTPPRGHRSGRQVGSFVSGARLTAGQVAHSRRTGVRTASACRATATSSSTPPPARRCGLLARIPQGPVRRDAGRRQPGRLPTPPNAGRLERATPPATPAPTSPLVTTASFVVDSAAGASLWASSGSGTTLGLRSGDSPADRSLHRPPNGAYHLSMQSDRQPRQRYTSAGSGRCGPLANEPVRPPYVVMQGDGSTWLSTTPPPWLVWGEQPPERQLRGRPRPW